MKKLFAVATLLIAASTSGVCDLITFNYNLGSNHSVDASLKGVLLGPAVNFSVSDQTTGESFPLTGVFASSTGTSSSFVVTTTPNLVLAAFNGAGPNSVLIVDTLGNVLVAGTMLDRSSVLSSYPAGTGAFLGSFDVTQVDPRVLALFGLGPAFSVDGSVSATFGDAQLVGVDHLTANIGGGSVTIVTPVPEIATLLLLGTGLLLSVYFAKRRGIIKFA